VNVGANVADEGAADICRNVGEGLVTKSGNTEVRQMAPASTTLENGAGYIMIPAPGSLSVTPHDVIATLHGHMEAFQVRV
jgi:hypothetical protein